MRDNFWSRRGENDEEYLSALQQRTEELYQVPDQSPDEDGIIEAAVLILRDTLVLPRMVAPIFINDELNLLALQEAQYNDEIGRASCRERV